MYKLRYSFDFGSGICLWCMNDAARERFGYPVASSAIPISQTLQKRIEFLVSWHDTFLDWDDVPESSRWSDREADQFRAAAQEVLHLLQEELGSDFSVYEPERFKPSSD